MEGELKEAFPGISITLVEGIRGVFNVEVDGKLIFSKYELDRLPDEGEIVQIIKG